MVSIATQKRSIMCYLHFTQNTTTDLRNFLMCWSKLSDVSWILSGMVGRWRERSTRLSCSSSCSGGGVGEAKFIGGGLWNKLSAISFKSLLEQEVCE